MERSYPRARLLVAAVALIAASVATTALADPGDPVDEVRQMHAETSARLSPEDRA